MLQDAFGLLVASVISEAADLWTQMRRAKATLRGILLPTGDRGLTRY